MKPLDCYLSSFDHEGEAAYIAEIAEERYVTTRMEEVSESVTERIKLLEEFCDNNWDEIRFALEKHIGGDAGAIMRTWDTLVREAIRKEFKGERR